MDRQAYLRALDAALTGKVAAGVRAQMLDYYEMVLDEAGLEGEEALLRELGHPAQLAGRLVEEGAFDPHLGLHRPPDGIKRAQRTGGLIVAAAVCAILLCAVVLGIGGKRTPPAEPSPAGGAALTFAVDN